MGRTGRTITRASLACSVTLLAALALGCGSSGLNRPVTTLELDPGPSGVQRANVTLHSFYFEPNRIVVHAGRPVELTLHNHALFVPHNFSISDETISVSRGVGGKRTHTIRFTPEKPGEYRFFCHVGSHAKKGMTGVLVVVP
jgi:plastocyanin